MKPSGPDSLNSWIISFACCFINMMMYGMARLSGVLFVASIPQFNVSREKASFPYTFANFMRNTSGPLVGFLGHRYGVRAVTTFGCILGAVGAGTCYLATSIDTVTVLWGAVFGLGFGLGNILLPVSINQYFDKHRATASGISFSGACLGSFVLPPIVEILLNTYGLPGTFLFLSGFVLNCVPAALLLKKPNFEIKASNTHDCEQSERQSIMSGMKVKLYSGENENQKAQINPKYEAEVDDRSLAGDKDNNGYNSVLTYDEKMKRLSTQTLLSDYSIRMSTSEPLDVEQIIENSKGRRTVDPKVLEAETLSLSSHNTDQDINSEKDDVFERNYRSSSVQYDKPVVPYNKIRALSSENISLHEEKNNFKNNKVYLNYGFQTSTDDINAKNGLDSRSSTIKDNPKKNDMKSYNNDAVSLNCAYEKNSNSFKYESDQPKISSNSIKNYSKSLEWSDIDTFKMKNTIISSLPEKDISLNEDKSSLGSFSVIFDPMFILIAITNALYCFTFVCMITIIVDFARDLQIGESNEKYVLMALSVGDLFGRLGLGSITDRGYMKTTTFAALCFVCQGVTIAATASSGQFSTLITLITLYGLSEAGLILIFPIIIAQYIDHDKQTVAIPSSNFLSGPLCLAVAPMIGYFRDEIGSYDYIFYGLAILSAACSLCFILAPYVAKCQRRSRCQTT